MEQEELMTKTLVDRIAALEQRVQQLEDSERECQKEKKALQQELAEIKDKSDRATQLEQVEDHLRQTEERLQLALNSAKMIVWEINLKTNQVVCCENATKVWGIQTGTGEEFFALVHPDDRQNIIQAHEQALAGETTYIQPFRVISPDGQVRWLHSQGTVYFDAAGEPERLIGISVDITERKQVQAELQEREQRFTTLFNGMEDWVLVYHLTPEYLPGKFIEVNEQACKRLGYTREELLTMCVTDILGSPTVIPQVLIEKVQTHKHIVLESIHRTKAGELIPVEVSATLFTLNDLPTIQAICRDITGRKQAAETLRASQERLVLANQVGKIGTCEWDFTTGKLTWSEEMEALFHLAPGSFEGSYEHWLKRVHPDDRAHADAAAQRTATEGIDFDTEFRILLPDGTVRWVVGKAQVFKDSSGKPYRLIGVNMDITDHKQVEELLRTNAERLRLALTAAKMGDWSWDATTDMVTFSSRAAEMFGIPAGTYMSWTEMRNLLHSEDRDRAKLAVEKAIAENSDYDIEYRVIHPDGEQRWVAVKGRAQYNASGQVMGMLGVVQDITSRKQVEAEREQLLLREQTARVEAESAKEEISEILESITDGFVAFDRQWRFTYINHKGTRTVGKSAQELLGKNLWEELPELAATSFGRLFQQAMVERVPLELEDYYPPFNSWFSVRVYPSDAGIVLYFRNISDRKQAEAEIAKLNRNLQNRISELQTLFEVIPIGILISDDPEFKQIRANPAFAKILGIKVNDHASFTPPTGSSHPGYKVFSNGKELAPDEIPLRYAAIHNVQLQGVEVDILRGDGVLFNLYGYASPLLDEQGKPRGAVGAFLDITDRKRAEAEREQLLAREKIAREQAEAANRVKDEFLAVLSHELRTPLNPILGWTRLLQTGKLDQQKTALALATIERNTKLQTQLIEDLLDISRILQGKLTLQVYPVDLAMTIEAAKETVRLAAEAKMIEIRTDLPSAVWMMGDANRLQQVIWNLLSNAVKFTPTGGLINVKLEVIDSGAQITVKDTGKGISPEFLPYVFEYFRQADSSITRQFGGLGLGLAIARQIVELHGGTIKAESPGEGLGATFTMRLPLIPVTTAINQNNRILNHNLTLQNKQILIVDDEADTRELIAFVLQEYGAKIITAASAQEALILLQELTLDLLISDIGMPEMDGYSLMRQVRSLNLTKQIPAIALTAYATEADQKQAILSGFQLHIAKPLEIEQLIQAIVSLLN
ncbi:PAS domain S-box protein [Phormidium sp. LEGE 05292]|uniref:PAS domain S-box protein n=1 Tax=[Phormidium] sp. LEGE 05292 TaxID=767427 RepID=UPI001882A33F|nr:PAS domain S-box protein [Phormidium sp. LEGE 05292]MBE9224925.1 PAS domain S-box protein [Phormidium sp. LEGE 05292]